MKLLAIDGNSILNRAYYGIRLLTNKNGVYTNAVLGFMNIYFKNFEEVKPDRVAVALILRLRLSGIRRWIPTRLIARECRRNWRSSCL